MSHLYYFQGIDPLLTAYPQDPRQRLNNLLQSKGMVSDIQWKITRQGPAHDAVWYAICRGSSSYWVVFQAILISYS